MPAPAKKPVTTPIPVQLCKANFDPFILPHLSMPKWGPKCKLSYCPVFNLILWVLYTGMQWKCLPVPKDGDGNPEIHYTTIYRAFAKWPDDGSMATAFIASVGSLSEQNQLDLSILHGDGGSQFKPGHPAPSMTYREVLTALPGQGQLVNL